MVASTLLRVGLVVQATAIFVLCIQLGLWAFNPGQLTITVPPCAQDSNGLGTLSMHVQLAAPLPSMIGLQPTAHYGVHECERLVHQTLSCLVWSAAPGVAECLRARAEGLVPSCALCCAACHECNAAVLQP